MAIPKLKTQEVHERFNRLRFQREDVIRERAPQIAFSANGLATKDRAAWLGIQCIKAAMLHDGEELQLHARELCESFADDWQEHLNLAQTLSLVGDIDGMRRSAELALRAEPWHMTYAVTKLAAAMLDVGVIEDAAQVLKLSEDDEAEPSIDTSCSRMSHFVTRWQGRGLDQSVLMAFLADAKASLRSQGWAFPVASFEAPSSDIGADLPVGIASFLLDDIEGSVVDIEERVLDALERAGSAAYLDGVLTASVEDVSE